MENEDQQYRNRAEVRKDATNRAGRTFIQGLVATVVSTLILTLADVVSKGDVIGGPEGALGVTALLVLGTVLTAAGSYIQKVAER